MRKKTFQEFVKNANIIHHLKYKYDETTYVNTHTKMQIICPEHGEFWQSPHSHMKYGCPKCAIKYRASLLTSNTDDFVKKAKKIYGDKYDYSKVKYTSCDKPVIIICPKHGEFLQTPNAHLHSKGCPLCVREEKNNDKRDSKETFIAKSIHLYGNKYNYDKVVYVNSRTPVIIKCPEHGEFCQTPHEHLHVGGCPICRKEKMQKIKQYKEKIKKDKQQCSIEIKQQIVIEKEQNFIKQSNIIHNHKYDYSKVKYKNIHEKVCIICPEHGEFWQSPRIHLCGHGCPKCGSIKGSNKLRFTRDTFIEKATKVHDDEYDYSKVNYINNNTKVCIICPTHGEFWQTPAMHYNERQGCPLCGTLSSSGEIDIYNFLVNKLPSEKIIQREHTIIKPQELDIYLPKYKIAIEYNGLRWHSEQFGKDKYYHLQKTKKCNEKGIRLIQIFEDEWLFHKEIVKHKLLHILHCDTESQKIYARKCKIKEIDSNMAKTFLNQFHLQGWVRSTIYLGLFKDDKIIATMGFLKDKDGFIMNRFSTDYHFRIVGAASKMLNFFMKNHQYSFITTFADLRWCTLKNNLYEKIGFTLEKIEKPDYSYVSSTTSFRKRYHKFMCRKKILSKKYNLPLTMTESEMAKKIGLHKIWNCGLVKYTIRNTKENTKFV